MKRIPQRSCLLAAATMAAGSTLVLGMPTANALVTDPTHINVGGSATLSPASGPGTNVVTVSAPTGQQCPATSSGVILFVTGPGLPTDGGVLTGFTPPEQATNGTTTTIGSASTLQSFFNSASVAAPDGDYTFRITCVGDDFVSHTDEWNVKATFTHAVGGPNNVSPYQTVVAAQSTTTTVSAPASATFGSPVTITASVTPATATGTVQFKDGGANLGAPQTVSNGVATFTTSSLPVGTRSLTAVYSGAPGFTTSTSAPASMAVNPASSGVSLSSNGPTEQFSPATFTATVTPASAGTVTFKEGTTTLGSGAVDGTGHATFTTSGLPIGTHSVTATFVPSAAGVSGATSTPLDHVVTTTTSSNPIAVENLEVTVAGGALTMAVQDDALVTFAPPALNADGDFYSTTGSLDEVWITDTRAGDPGWVASAVASDFTSTTGGVDAINGFNLGWTPKTVALSPNQDGPGGFTLGAPVVGAKAPTVDADPADTALGLGAARTFGTAPAGHGIGTAKLDADLALNIPTDVDAGVYKSLLTFTVVG